MALLGNQPDNGGLSLRYKASDTVGSRLNPRLFAPVNRRSFFLRPRDNEGIIRLQPFLYHLRVLLVGALDRFLLGKAPTFEILLSNRSNRHLDTKLLLDQQPHSIPCPQGKDKLKLLWRLVNQVSFQFYLLFFAKGSILSFTTTASPQLDGRGTLLLLALPNLVRNPLFPKTNNLLPDLILRLRTMFASIYLFHSERISPNHQYDYI
jgi:hypothetical protein